MGEIDNKNNKKEIKNIFNRVKRLHLLYNKGNEEYKQRLFDQLEPDFKRLEILGVARHFSEALLFYGKEFVESVYQDSVKRSVATANDAAAIFGSTVTQMSEDQQIAHKIALKNNIKNYEIVKKDGKIGIKPR